MPRLKVLFFRDGARVPVLEWIDGLDEDTQARVGHAIRQLSISGHMLRRPAAAHLSDGIHELRFHLRRVQHRILYFFHGRTVVVLSHHFTKQQARVPEVELRRAATNRERFLANPFAHAYGEDHGD